MSAKSNPLTLKGPLLGLLAAAFLATPAFAQTPTPTLNSGDAAWLLTSAALVLMMTIPGLGLFYDGMVRKKNVLAQPGAEPVYRGYQLSLSAAD